MANGEAAARDAAARAAQEVRHTDGKCDCCGGLTLSGAEKTLAALGASRCERCKGAVAAMCPALEPGIATSENDALLVMASVAHDAWAGIAAEEERQKALRRIKTACRATPVREELLEWLSRLMMAVGVCWAVKVDLVKHAPLHCGYIDGKKVQPKARFTWLRLVHGAALSGPKPGKQKDGGACEDWEPAQGRHLMIGARRAHVCRFERLLIANPYGTLTHAFMSASQTGRT